MEGGLQGTWEKWVTGGRCRGREMGWSGGCCSFLFCRWRWLGCLEEALSLKPEALRSPPALLPTISVFKMVIVQVPAQVPGHPPPGRCGSDLWTPTLGESWTPLAPAPLSAAHCEGEKEGLLFGRAVSAMWTTSTLPLVSAHWLAAGE